MLKKGVIESMRNRNLSMVSFNQEDITSEFEHS